jgi:DNA repair protein RecN (Recombination protein N)
VIEHLHVRNFAVARDVAISLPGGLIVFTGETGSGKSLVVDALAFAFGNRAGREVIAGGAERATVGVRCSGGPFVERSVGLAGRSSCQVDGAQATIDDVRALGERLIEIHSQSGQLVLLKPAAQLEVLDQFGGRAADAGHLAALVRELRQVRRRIDSLQADTREHERLVDRLRFEIDEIDSAALRPGEDESLRSEQQRLANAESLRGNAAAAIEVLDSDQLATLTAALAAISDRDPGASGIADFGLLLQSTLDDLRRKVRAYADTLEEDPERLQEVNARLDLLARMRRKYGETLPAILEYVDAAREQLASLTGAGDDLAALHNRETQLAVEAANAAQSLSLRRREAAARLVDETARELATLGMGGAALAIGFECRDGEGGLLVSLPDFENVSAGSELFEPGAEHAPRAFTESGVDRVEFMASFNPGMPARPLAEVASGGETSRFLLALTAVFGNAAPSRTIVLDEVDEGVGGRAGAMVGEALARLARRHQVLCITHLPQVAAYGDHHLVVSKESDGKSTWSTVRPVEGEARVAELAAMLGGATPENVAAARSLLEFPAASRA